MPGSATRSAATHRSIAVPFTRVHIPPTAFAQVPQAACLSPWTSPDRWADTNGDRKVDPEEPYEQFVTGYIPDDAGAV